MAHRPILCNGPWWEVVPAMAATGLGLAAFAAALDRFLLQRAPRVERALLLAGSVLLFWPDIRAGWLSVPAYVADVAGAILPGTVFELHRTRRASAPAISPLP